MENRFAFKDLVIVSLLLLLLIAIGVKFVQDDRQWQRLGQMDTVIEGQGRDIAAVRRLLSDGNFARATGDSRPTEPVREDIFRRIRDVKENPDYAQGDWLIESFGSAPPTLNPLIAGDVYGKIVQAKIIESLAVYDIETLELAPLLARDWQVADDGMSVTFQLRENVLFSDGEPMTADDVIHSLKMITHPDIADGRYIQWYSRIEKVEALGPYEVRFTFNERHYDNVARAAGLGVVPEHLYDGLTDRQIRQSTALLMGTGPYRLQDPHEYTPGSQIEVVRNNRYWGEQPTFDRLVWRIIEQDSTELVEFQNGTVDIIAPQPRDHVQMVEDEELLEEKNYKVYDTMRTLYQYVAWNQQRGGEPTIFADKRVRQAMTLLIDREQLLNEVFLGFGSIASGPFHQISPQADPDIEPWPHDPDQAMEILTEVGFTRAGEDTPLLDPEGDPFEITLVYPSGSELYDRVALSLRDNLARAGIDLKLDPQRWSLLLATLDSRDFDAITLGWGAGGVESDIEQMFHSRTIDGGDNRNAYSSPELDEVIDTAHVTLDDDERMKLWQQAHRILHEDQPYTFLLFGKPRLWYDNRIEGIVEMPKLGINAATTWPVPIEWYVPEGQQKR